MEGMFARGLLHGTMHLYIGEEAVAEGACAALDDGDLITSTHRGHGHALAHGAELLPMMSEILAKETGYCRGRGGSMHIADVDNGNLGANGIVAGSITIAVGAAYAQKFKNTGKVVVCFFGDGAANEGSFHEALNMAGIWNLPVVFVCENNQYGMSMSQARSTAGGSVAARASGYGFDGININGSDVVEVFTTTRAAIDKARVGGGPTLIECETYRYRGHSKSDRNLYRTQDEIDEWQTERDPMKLFEKYALDNGLLSEDDITTVQDRVNEAVRIAVQEAFDAPPASPADLEGAQYA